MALPRTSFTSRLSIRGQSQKAKSWAIFPEEPLLLNFECLEKTHPTAALREPWTGQVTTGIECEDPGLSYREFGYPRHVTFSRP